MAQYQTNCRHFNGYKPCALNASCDALCPCYSKVGSQILIVHLGALGAVVRSTGLLQSIKAKYPDSKLTWVTQKPADHLLRSHPLVDRVLTTQVEDLLALSALSFDVAFVIDKSLVAAGVLKHTKVNQIYGFKADPVSGAILPATLAAEELWKIGLDDHLKFRVNSKSELRLIIESLELPVPEKMSYHLPLTATEQELTQQKRKLWGDGGQLKIVGINTGCSDVIKYKKLTVQAHRDLLVKLMKNPQVQIVLLGGPEDSERNQQIADGLPVLISETKLGLREGLTSVAACDVVFTGDSLGMHMALSQNVWTVAWFGPTCAHEIDFFGAGEALLSKATCGPCWKRNCQKEVMCYDLLDLDQALSAILNGLSLNQPLDSFLG